MGVSKKHKIFSLILIISGLFLGLLIGEFSCRTYSLFKNSTTYRQASLNPKLIVEPKPNIEYINKFGIRRKLNSTGFEGPELSNINNCSLKIIFLGDSIIEEGYLPKEKRLPNLLKTKASQYFNEEIVVWNAGVSGYNSWQILEILKDKVLNYHPDLIIIGICQNDFVDTLPKVFKVFNRTFLIMRDGSKARFLDWLYQRSEFYKHAYDALANLHRLRLNDKGYERYLKNYHFNISENQLERWKQCIKDIGNTAKTNSIETIFLVFPLHSQLVQNNNLISKQLDDLFIEEGYNFVDLFDVFIDKYEGGLSLYRKHDIIHLNEKGIEIAAEAIFDYMKLKKIGIN